MQFRFRRSPAVLLAAAALMSACADAPTGVDPVAPAPIEPDTASAVILNSTPFYSGAYLGDDVSTPEKIGPAIAEFARLSGKHPSLVKTFHDLNCDFTATGWCGQVLRNVSRAGSTNFLAIDVRWAGAPTTGLLDAINAGKADARITAVARALKGVGAPVLLEPAWEMNGNWNFAWQGTTNGGAAGPAKYVAAWRRIVGIFRREGATNVRWVWNPNVGNAFTYSASGASHWNWYANYYPGPDYVDYVGAHGFNAPRVWGGAWQSFATMADGAAADYMLSDLARRYPRKPILIGEFATDEGTAGQKAQWITNAYRTLRSRPNVVGAVWFNMNKEADWRINSSSTALTAFRAAMADGAVQTAFVPVSPGPALLAAN